MCDCKKNTDGFCGTCGGDKFDGLFGYKININKKESTGTDDTEKDKNKKNSGKKMSNLKETGNAVKDFLSGLKKEPVVDTTQYDSSYTQDTKSSGGAMKWVAFGIGIVIIVVVFIYFKNKK